MSRNASALLALLGAGCLTGGTATLAAGSGIGGALVPFGLGVLALMGAGWALTQLERSIPPASGALQAYMLCLSVVFFVIGFGVAWNSYDQAYSRGVQVLGFIAGSLTIWLGFIVLIAWIRSTLEAPTGA